MKIGFIIICRYNSNRLPGKILRKIKGKPILQYIFERLNYVVLAENIVIATSTESTDDPIEQFCIDNGYQCFRGSLNNVAERFLKCTEKFEFDFATRINGDNLFIDISTLKGMIEIASSNKYDFISNVKNRTYPKGMSIEIVKTSYYKECYQKFSDESHFEHVTLYLYENDRDKKHYYYFNTTCPETAGMQLAIDTEEDFAFAEKIFCNFSTDHFNYGLEEIYEIIKMIK